MNLCFPCLQFIKVRQMSDINSFYCLSSVVFKFGTSVYISAETFCSSFTALIQTSSLFLSVGVEELRDRFSFQTRNTTRVSHLCQRHEFNKCLYTIFHTFIEANERGHHWKYYIYRTVLIRNAAK
jgi:hypothetical protein